MDSRAFAACPPLVVADGSRWKVLESPTTSFLAVGLSSDYEHSEAGFLKPSTQSWIGAVAVCRGSDLAASGAGNGLVRLWAVGDEQRIISLIHDVPLE
ncbi:U3 snoRNP-associated protein-like [Nymphaea thermarum]|nr:U3 snoRNP-associated protein-like [Nymphaea thermarum]